LIGIEAFRISAGVTVAALVAGYQYQYQYHYQHSKMAECRPAYQFKDFWVNDIYLSGIEQEAEIEVKNHDRIWFLGRDYTPKERRLTYYWEPVYELSKEVDRFRIFEEMPSPEWKGFMLMAIQKEGCEYSRVVEVKIDYAAGSCSLVACKNFEIGDVVTVLSEYEAKMEKKVLIFGGTCAESGDSKTQEGGKPCNAMITTSRTIRCVREIRKGKEIIVNFDLDAGHPINFLDRMVHSRNNDNKVGRVVGYEEERDGEVLHVEFDGEEKKRTCRRGQVHYVYFADLAGLEPGRNDDCNMVIDGRSLEKQR
jgi:hypothetical protein